MNVVNTSRCRPGQAMVAVLLGAMVAFFAGCDTSSTALGTVTRDSSGVTIVENRDSASTWSVQHQLTIGVTSGDPSYQLDRVRDATRLPDGRIVTVNGGSADLRFFGPDGTHLQTIGQSGSGPGDYRVPSSVHRREDTLAVWDSPRTTLLSASGELITTHALERLRSVLTLQPHGMPMRPERLDDGSFIMRVSPDSERRSAGEYRPEIGVLWLSHDLEESHLIGMFPDVMHVNVGTASQPMGLAVPMSPHVLYAAGGDPLRVYVSWSDAFEVLEYSTDGSLRRIIRKTHIPIPISDDVLSPVHEQRLSALERTLPPDEAQRRLNLVPDPESYPALDALFVDERGWLWTRDYLTTPHTTTRFSVFDATGTLRAEVEVPSRFEPFEATADYVLGLSRDENDVERVELYDIVP